MIREKFSQNYQTLFQEEQNLFMRVSRNNSDKPLNNFKIF